MGIWPPACPLVVGFAESVLGPSLYGVRVLNLLFVLAGMFCFAVSTPKPRRWGALLVAMRAVRPMNSCGELANTKAGEGSAPQNGALLARAQHFISKE
jgi:hypothetical protein